MLRRALLCTMSVLLLGPWAATAEEPKEKASWSDRIRLGGDFRLRYEGFDWEGNFDDGDRDRFRYRYRIRLEADVAEDWKVGTSIRSGEPRDPVSDNRTFGAGFDKGLVNLAEIYARYQPNETFRLSVGKFSPEKLWRASDLEWDDDVNPEGAMEEIDFDFDGVVDRLEINLFQFVGVERSSAGDSYLLGAQVAPVFRFGEKNELVTGVSYEHWGEPTNLAALSEPFVSTVDPDGIPVLLGNDMTNLVFTNGAGDLVLVSDFEIASAFAIWKNTSFENWPLQAEVFYYKNLGAGENVGTDLVYGAAGTGDDNDTACLARVQVGDTKKPGQVAMRLTRYMSEPDAVLYTFSQSDHERASNVDGYRVDVRVGGWKSSSFNVSYYDSEPELGDDTTMHRWQVDWQIAF